MCTCYSNHTIQLMYTYMYCTRVHIIMNIESSTVAVYVYFIRVVCTPVYPCTFIFVFQPLLAVQQTHMYTDVLHKLNHTLSPLITLTGNSSNNTQAIYKESTISVLLRILLFKKMTCTIRVHLNYHL